MIGHRPLRATASLFLALVLLLLGTSRPAHAHANLVRTDPAEGAVLQSAPSRILFTFDEPVRAVPDGVQIFDPQGDPVAAGTTATGSELAVALTERPLEGTIVITWRVVSEDGHPISGALTFSVGAPSTPGIATPPSFSNTVPEVPWVLTLARWLGYAGLLLAAGLVVFTAVFLPAGPGTGRARHRAATLTRAAVALAAVAWTAALPITAVYLLGGGPELLGEGSTWSSLPPAEYAVVAVVVAGLAAAAGLGTSPGSRRRRVAAVAAATAAVIAPALTGHTRAAGPEALVVGADALHLLAGSVWLGGLAGLALTLPALSGHGAAAARTLTRFSATAAAVLVALIATGSLLAWRILGSWSALAGTGYGRLLLAKIALVLAALAIAAWNRWSLLPRVAATKSADRRTSARPVVRATAIEGSILVAALLITGFLVDTSPEAAPARPAAVTSPGTRTTTLGDIAVEATLTPLSRGPNTITLKLRSASGEPAEGVAPPVVRLSSERAPLGAVPLTQVSAGFYTAQVTIPAPGTWRMQVSLRVTQFTNPVGELEFVIAG
ncbi:transport integral membrane protein [Actinoplanes italicus]|uniref:Copper transport protein n=1 Tax=Actinoplanes italicus TaxID=113567 RepID=A0A2T0K8W6_9ACTN|nr:copper resistance protein CopC [Actinoplanes italicus]PRX19512.1 copper transport protein [Actinoplanes italicus]GIE30473.1 transport integral membrane protein [Actinoplanes italicus]